MVRPSLATTLVVALLAILGLMAVALTQRARSQRAVPRPAPALQVPTRELRPLPHAAPPKPAAYSVLHMRAAVQLRSKPRGKVVATVAARTQFGSPTTLTAVAHRSGWLGVTST